MFSPRCVFQCATLPSPIFPIGESWEGFPTLVFRTSPLQVLRLVFAYTPPQAPLPYCPVFKLVVFENLERNGSVICSCDVQ
ncbi:Uncharacterized protein APZ42_008247 [Daphnia magna]|uniref:Uncharacterized protein n=1 Tax=Daphnia magna TaxID=35525 RepID=A0A0P6A3Q3_9CRUS|nr:Uncharacterized protein APZ42_008247 [Daphnia magna]